MSSSSFSHVWTEFPMLPHVLAKLPAGVTVIQAAAAPAYNDAFPAQIMFAGSLVRYDGALMDALPNLRLIARTGIGVDNVDLPAATERGVLVTNTPDGPTESTAEHTVAMLLALAKRLKPGDANMAAGGWGPRGPLVGTEVQGKILGVVGLGRIGRRVAQICRLGLEMKVIGYDPYVTPQQADALGIVWADLDSVIRQADFLSVHVPATTETRHLINRNSIATMKDGAYLLNLARGPLVDEAALLEAINSGKLAGAGIDVFDPEPPAVDSPLRNHPKIIATPHVASNTVESVERMQSMAMERVLTFMRGERPQDVVNPDVYKRGLRPLNA